MRIFQKNYSIHFLCQICIFLFAWASFAQGDIKEQISNIEMKQNLASYAQDDLANIALLELQGKGKGFLFPRMTTRQRDAIKVDSYENADKEGLVIYNTTTDCIDYYNKDRKTWVSLCGEELPAQFSINASQCAKTKVFGTYYKEKELDDSCGLLLEVTVSRGGSYEVIAETDNGYGYQTKGKFPAAGVYSLYLKGEGKPIKSSKRDNGIEENVLLGDLVRFYLNGKKSNCNNSYVFVEDNPPSFLITETTTKGEYSYRREVDDSNYIEALVDVEHPGKYTIYSNTVSGVSFKGEGIFTKNGKNQKVILKAEGKPLNPGLFDIKLYSNSKYEFGHESAVYEGANYLVLGGSYDIICDSIITSGVIKFEKEFTVNHEISVLIKVQRPGPASVTMINKNKVEDVLFESGDLMLELEEDSEGELNYMQRVVLKNKSGIAYQKKGIVLNVEGVGYEPPLANAECKPVFPVAEGPAKFTISGSPTLFSKFEWNPGFLKTKIKYITPSTDMTPAGSNEFTIRGVSVNVQKAGIVKVKTNTVNGIYFMYEGTINLLGQQNIIMKAYGVSEKDGDGEKNEYIFNYFSEGKETLFKYKRVKVDFMYRPMTILSIGELSWHPGGTRSSLVWYYGAGPDMVNNIKLIGPEKHSLLRVENVKFISVGPSIFKKSNLGKFEQYLKSVDAVFIGGTVYDKGKEQLDILADYIKTKNLPVLYAESNRGADGLLGQTGVGGSLNKRNIQNYMIPFLSHFTDDKDLAVVSPRFMKQIRGNKVVNSITEDSQKIILSDKFTSAYAVNLTGAKNLLGGILAGVIYDMFAASDISTSEHLNKLPSGFAPIASYNDEGSSDKNVWAMIHKKYGLTVVLDSHFGGGTDGSLLGSIIANNAYPLGVKSGGEPVEVKYFMKNEGTFAVYNNYFYLNSIYWLIDYAQKHQNNKKK